MRPLSSDVREFIRIQNTKSVKYLIVGAWAVTFHGRWILYQPRSFDQK